jgi:hypothetical protein
MSFAKCPIRTLRWRYHMGAFKSDNDVSLITRNSRSHREYYGQLRAKFLQGQEFPLDSLSGLEAASAEAELQPTQEPSSPSESGISHFSLWFAFVF